MADGDAENFFMAVPKAYPPKFVDAGRGTRTIVKSLTSSPTDLSGEGCKSIPQSSKTNGSEDRANFQR